MSGMPSLKDFKTVLKRRKDYERENSKIDQKIPPRTMAKTLCRKEDITMGAERGRFFADFGGVYAVLVGPTGV